MVDAETDRNLAHRIYHDDDEYVHAWIILMKEDFLFTICGSFFHNMVEIVQ